MFMMTAKSIIKDLAETQIPANEVLTRANEKLCEGNEADMFVTAWLGFIDLTNGHVTFANAGHNPPVICRSETGPEYLKSKVGFVLGGMPGIKYPLQEMDLVPGDRIYLYTDGVTEATRLDGVLYGDDRLKNYLELHPDSVPEAVLKGVKADIDDFVGEAEQFDDITMLMFDFKETVGGKGFKEKVFAAEVNLLNEAMAFITEEMEAAEVPMKPLMQISVAFEEMFVNVAHYAYPSGNGDVSVGISVSDGMVTVKLTDSGIPFNPLEHKNPDVTLSSDEREIGGLGIYMVMKTMDGVAYEYLDGQNIFIMKKHF